MSHPARRQRLAAGFQCGEALSEDSAPLGPDFWPRTLCRGRGLACGGLLSLLICSPASGNQCEGGCCGLLPALLCKPRVRENLRGAQGLSDRWAIVISGRRKGLSILVEMRGGKVIHRLPDFQPFSGMLCPELSGRRVWGPLPRRPGLFAQVASSRARSSASAGNREAGIAQDPAHCFQPRSPSPTLGRNAGGSVGFCAEKKRLSTT